MTPNSTNARRQIENLASRAPGNGARIRNLGAESAAGAGASMCCVFRRMRHLPEPPEGTGRPDLKRKHY